MLSHSVTPTSSLWRQLAALIYDIFIITALMMIIGMLSELVTWGTLIETNQNGTHISWWYQPLQYIIVCAYFVLSWHRGGQTLGMRAWRIKLVSTASTHVSFKQTLSRAGVMSLPLLLLTLSLFTPLHLATALYTPLIVWLVFFGVVLIPPKHLSIQDYLSSTRIVCLPKH